MEFNIFQQFCLYSCPEQQNNREEHWLLKEKLCEGQNPGTQAKNLTTRTCKAVSELSKGIRFCVEFVVVHACLPFAVVKTEAERT